MVVNKTDLIHSLGLTLKVYVMWEKKNYGEKKPWAAPRKQFALWPGCSTSMKTLLPAAEMRSYRGSSWTELAQRGGVLACSSPFLEVSWAMGPPRNWGNSLELNSIFLSVLLSSTPAQTMLALPWLSQSFQAAFCPWVGKGGGGEKGDRMNIRRGTRKYFKQDKLWGNNLPSSVGQWNPRSEVQGLWLGSNLPHLPRFSSSFPGLISEGLSGGGQDVIPFWRPNTLPKFQRLSLEPGALAKQILVWLQPQVLLKYLCPAPTRNDPRAQEGR